MTLIEWVVTLAVGGLILFSFYLSHEGAKADKVRQQKRLERLVHDAWWSGTRAGISLVYRKNAGEDLNVVLDEMIKNKDWEQYYE